MSLNLILRTIKFSKIVPADQNIQETKKNTKKKSRKILWTISFCSVLFSSICCICHTVKPEVILNFKLLHWKLCILFARRYESLQAKVPLVNGTVENCVNLKGNRCCLACRFYLPWFWLLALIYAPPVSLQAEIITATANMFNKKKMQRLRLRYTPYTVYASSICSYLWRY